MKRPRLHIILIFAAMIVAAALQAQQPEGGTPRRRITPVNNAATQTQAINEAKDDTSRINAARRDRSTHYHDSEGRVVWVDTLTGEEWVDSLATGLNIPKMKQPLLYGVAVGVDVWDPVMRAFGQRYGLVGFSAELNLHNRYIPVVEVGLGQAKNTPADGNFTYTSPVSPYFRVGANYNFLFNSDPGYMLVGGLRYGFTPFSYRVTDVTVDSPYWDETATFSLPLQHATAGWFEIVLGVRVKLWRGLSAGWLFKFHQLLHESSMPSGPAWYIPGYGTRNGSITGAFSFTYTLPLTRYNRRQPATVAVDDLAE